MSISVQPAIFRIISTSSVGLGGHKHRSQCCYPRTAVVSWERCSKSMNDAANDSSSIVEGGNDTEVGSLNGENSSTATWYSRVMFVSAKSKRRTRIVFKFFQKLFKILIKFRGILYELRVKLKVL